MRNKIRQRIKIHSPIYFTSTTLSLACSSLIRLFDRPPIWTPL